MTGDYSDFHSHLIPGVDDGARDVELSLAALGAFRREGVRQLITTPHFDGALTQQPERLAARLAEIIDSRQVQQLPLNGRQATQLLLLEGAVDAGTATANQTAVRDAFYTWTGARTPDLVLQLGERRER